MRIKKDDAVKRVSEAEKALSAGDHQHVVKLLDETGRFRHEWALSWHVGDRALETRARLIVAIAYVRLDPATAADMMEIVAMYLEDRPDDPLLRARLAEAQAVAGWTTKDATLVATGKAALEKLARQDLLAEPEAWATLARLRTDARDAKGALEAGARCRKLTTRKGVCPAEAT